MSNEWRCLYQIENWKNKTLELNVPDGDIVTHTSLNILDNLHLVYMHLDRDVWREKESDLPSYCDWSYDIRINTGPHGVLTTKELIRRYIEHLAGILNEGWVPDWNKYDDYASEPHSIYYDHDEGVFHIDGVDFLQSDEIYFKSREAAEKVIKVAEEQLRILFGV